MRSLVIAVVAIVVLAVAGYVGWTYWSVQRAAVQWEGKVPEIVSEKIEKDGDVATIELSSRIDAPVADVFEAFRHPERTEKLVDQIKRSRVVEETPERKRVEFHLTTLGQLQVLTVDLSYDPKGREIGIKTVEGATEIEGTYRLEPSPDGRKTLVVYHARQRNKLPLPVPANVERSAIKEQFASLMRAIKEDLKAQGKLQAAVEPAWGGRVEAA